MLCFIKRHIFGSKPGVCFMPFLSWVRKTELQGSLSMKYVEKYRNELLLLIRKNQEFYYIKKLIKKNCFTSYLGEIYPWDWQFRTYLEWKDAYQAAVVPPQLRPNGLHVPLVSQGTAAAMVLLLLQVCADRWHCAILNHFWNPGSEIPNWQTGLFSTTSFQLTLQMHCTTAFRSCQQSLQHCLSPYCWTYAVSVTRLSGQRLTDCVDISRNL